MTVPKVEPCILSQSIRASSVFLTWWLLTALWTTVSVALFTISHCVTWSKLVGRWERGTLQWEAPFCSSFFDCEAQTLLWSLSFLVCLFLHPIRVFISDPLILYASPTIMKEKQDKSVLLFFFPAVLKNIKHLKKSIPLCLSFLLCFFSSCLFSAQAWESTALTFWFLFVWLLLLQLTPNTFF